MGERLINPLLNVQAGKKYKKMIFINPYRFGFVDATANVFLGTVNNLWSNPANWSRGYVPTVSEKARIRATCVLDIHTEINELQVDETFNLTFLATTQRILTINGDCNVNGTIDLSLNGHILILKGETNYFFSSSFGNNSTVRYERTSSQNIFPASYKNLSISGAGIKQFTANTTIRGNLSVLGVNKDTSTIDFSSYNIEVQGTSVFSQVKIYRSGHGNLVFVGSVSSYSYGVALDFSVLNSSDVVEFRGGHSIVNSPSNWGNTTVKYTTNNQTIQWGDYQGAKYNIVQGNITVTATGTWGVSSINGTTANSRVLNQGILGYSGLNFLEDIMPTGILDLSNVSNTVFFRGNGSSEIPNLPYKNLMIGGSGIKTVSYNMALPGNLTLSGNGHANSTFQIGAYNLTVNGTTNVSGCKFKRTGTGDTVFVGRYTSYNYGAMIDFSLLTAANFVEFRNGLDITNTQNASGYFFGGAVVKFTSNNQQMAVGDSMFLTSSQILIEGNITLTNGVIRNSNVSAVKIDGTNSLSQFVNNANGNLNYTGLTEPMLIGAFNSENGRIAYSGSGNQDVKGGTYHTLEFGGSGVKKLLGNVVVNISASGSWSITGTATIDYNGFTISTV